MNNDNKLDFPDIEITKRDEDHEYRDTNYFKYVMKVFSKSKNKYIGWITCRNIGVKNVKEFYEQK